MGRYPGSREAARDAASRRLMVEGRGPGTLERQPVPLSLWGSALMDDVSVSHFAGTPSGWGIEQWQRRLMTIHGLHLDPWERKLWADLEDQRGELLVGSFFGLDNPKFSDELLDGWSVVSPHGGWSHFRARPDYVADPSDGIIHKIDEHVPHVTAAGILLQRFSTNLLTRSSFVSGVGGLTLAGTGVNGSAITADATSTIFASAVTTTSLKFLAGNAHAADLTATWAATASVLAGSYVCLSVDHMDDSGVALEWQLTRAVDGWYFNDTSGAFQAGAIWNAFPVVATPTRHYSKPIPVGASNTTLTPAFGLTSGGTASRINHLYHAQLDLDRRWPSSHLVTDTTADSREANAFVICNDADRRVWNSASGTFLIRKAPLYSTSIATSFFFPIVLVYFDVDNYHLVYSDTSQGVVHARRRGGTTTEAVVAATLTRGEEIAIGIRWATASDGSSTRELDSLYGMATSGKQAFDVWVQVAGTITRGSGNSSLPPVETDLSTIYLGSNGSESAEGYLRQARFLPFVLTDLEMARWLAA